MPSKIDTQLPLIERDALIAELQALAAEPTLAQIQAAAARRGLRISLMSAMSFRDTTFQERLDDLERKRGMAQAITSVADAGKGLSDAAMALAAKRRFEQLMSGEAIDDETMSTIMLDLSRAQAGDRGAKKLESDLKLRDEQIATLQAERDERERKKAELLAKIDGAKKKGGLTKETLEQIQREAKLL